MLCSCQSNRESVSVLTVDDSPLIVCDESNIVKKEDIKLSELVDGLKIIPLDNQAKAFFKFKWMAFSEHYICIWQSGGSVKLFDKNGNYLCDMGAVGQGPGEYSSVYDALIDEAGKAVYLAPFTGKSIFKYDLQGQFVGQINFNKNLNKPRLFLNIDSTISIVHLCFKDRGDRFVAANIPTSNMDSIRYTYVDELATTYKDKGGNKNGLNQEVWSYRNEENFPFMLTSTDTLYHYNSISNEIKAHFTMKMNPEKKGDSFFIFNELPHHYLVFVVGENGETILVDKEKQEASHVRFIDDKLCDLELFPHFQDGYFFDMYEPAVLKEKLMKRLESGSVSDSQAKQLKELISSLNDNDNNILILGKLKK